MNSPRILSLLAGLSLLASPAWTQDTEGASPIQKPKPRVSGVDVTFLANQGFLLESGRYSVLIDAFLREPTGIYGALPTLVYKDLVNARPPYDGLTVVLVSHAHPDHVQMRGLEKYLENNNLAQLMASASVFRTLKESARDFEAIQRRVTPVPTGRGRTNKIMQEEMSVEFLELQHGGKGNEDVQNVGHLIEMGGLRILHVGDADPSVQNFEAYRLAERGIDLAFVPYWFFATEAGPRVLAEQIKPRWAVACHVPPAEVEKLAELLAGQSSDVILFKETLDQRHFEPQGAAPDAPEDGRDG